MSTVPPEVAPTADELLANIPFDYPGADIILRSQDSHHFQVPKTLITNNSPVLGELIRRTLSSPDDTDTGVSLPVVQLPDSGKILHYLLTFIFPITPVMPSTHEEAMELLSVAQKYQMGTVLIHIRGSIARQNPLPTRLEPALRIYSLAQKYGLRQEALQTARNILQHPMTVENFDNMLDFIPGASLYELMKYYESVQAILASALREFRRSTAHGTIKDIPCIAHSSFQVPIWINDYIKSIGRTPNLFDLVEFNTAMSSHIKATAAATTCECSSIPSQTIRKFWEALASVVHGSYDRVSVVDVPSCLGC
jgi:BTB/POZ domain